MGVPVLVEKSFLKIVDLLFAILPQRTPSLIALQQCRIVSHRGEHDNKTIFENTIEAFDLAASHGVWGLEFDIRWSVDLVPVVFHDEDCLRVFGGDKLISEMTFGEIRDRFPLIPSLEEVIRRYGKSNHLMVELKKSTYPQPDLQTEKLKDLFHGLCPAEDYHFITLDLPMFDHVNFLEPKVLLPVGEMNFKQMSEAALSKRYGGVTGYFLFFNDRLVSKHQALGQQIGTGFPASRNALYREINRNIDWIFSNHAVKLQQIIKQQLS